MQTNLQSTTFNSHNRLKDEYKNYRYDPHVNRISDDLRYKRRSITNTERNPVHINGGPEYLYNKRIEEIKRKLNTHTITVDQYNAELKRIQIARFGRPIMNEDVIVKPVPVRREVQPVTKEEAKDDETVETNDANDEVANQEVEDNRNIVDIINDPNNTGGDKA